MTPQEAIEYIEASRPPIIAGAPLERTWKLLRRIFQKV
jgi:hypothetical protein